MPNDRDQPYLKDLDDVTFDPIFILGLHRSGTSILYKTLTATHHFNPITAYHLIRYRELLYNHHHHTEDQAKDDLTTILRAKGLSDRGIDRLEITADFPEEYGFLLGHQTIRQSLTPTNLHLFIQLGKKLQYIADNNKPLLAKNPYDFPNFLYLKAVFPSARFIFIHRHPLKTLSSSLKAWQLLITNKNPYTDQLAHTYSQMSDNPLLHLPLRTIFLERPEIGAVLLTTMAAHATTYYLEHIHRLASNDYIAVTYEQLCSHPEMTLKNVMSFLQLPTDLHEISASIASRDIPIDSVIQKLSPYIFRAMKPYCTAFGYTPAISSTS